MRSGTAINLAIFLPFWVQVQVKFIITHAGVKIIQQSHIYTHPLVGIKIINHLINEARKLNIEKLSLETGAGTFFLPARKLFISCGFKICEPFSHYKDNVNSVYMCLLISNKT